MVGVKSDREISLACSVVTEFRQEGCLSEGEMPSNNGKPGDEVLIRKEDVISTKDDSLGEVNVIREEINSDKETGNKDVAAGMNQEMESKPEMSSDLAEVYFASRRVDLPVERQVPSSDELYASHLSLQALPHIQDPPHIQAPLISLQAPLLSTLPAKTSDSQVVLPSRASSDLEDNATSLFNRSLNEFGISPRSPTVEEEEETWVKEVVSSTLSSSGEPMHEQEASVSSNSLNGHRLYVGLNPEHSTVNNIDKMRPQSTGASNAAISSHDVPLFPLIDVTEQSATVENANKSLEGCRIEEIDGSLINNDYQNPSFSNSPEPVPSPVNSSNAPLAISAITAPCDDITDDGISPSARDVRVTSEVVTGSVINNSDCGNTEVGSFVGDSSAVDVGNGGASGNDGVLSVLPTLLLGRFIQISSVMYKVYV